MRLQSSRYLSLDVFRGATVALMILVNNPGTWDHVFSPLLHASWHGCTPTDLVFPFFLFAVGNAIAFVIPKLKEQGSPNFWKKVIKRTVLIFLIGLFLNWWPFFNLSEGNLFFKEWVDANNSLYGVRIFGVLQRIALAYFFASVIAYYFRPRQIIYVAILLLMAYWALCYFLGKEGDPYSLNGWFGTAIDINILGEAHLYRGEGIAFDPEGIMSTIPSIVQSLIGYLVGVFILAKGQVNWIWRRLTIGGDDQFRLLAILLVTGFIVLLLGWTWSLGFPINKKIWTSSYVLYTSGLAILTLGTVIWYVELLKVNNLVTSFFTVFGKNPLFIYILSSAIPSLMEIITIQTARGKINLWTWFYEDIFAHLPGPPELGSFVFALIFLILMWLIGYVLDQKKIYIKV